MDEKQSLTEALREEFDKQTEAPSPSEEPEAEVASAEAEVTETEETSEEVTEVSPPEHWSDEDKKAFLAMDESGREWALRLEKNAHKGIEAKSKELKTFRSPFEQYRHLVPEGMEAEAIERLLGAQAYLTQNPREGLAQLAKMYGVDEKQPETETPAEDLYADPQVLELRKKVSELTDQAEQQAREAENRRQAALFAEVQQFREAADEEGNLLHPHFQAVQGVMAGLMQSGKAVDLDSAYEQAVWSLPEYRDDVIERQAKERANKELEAKIKEAEKAEAAAKTVKGKSSAKAPKKPNTLAGDLKENYEKSVKGEL